MMEDQEGMAAEEAAKSAETRDGQATGGTFWRLTEFINRESKLHCGPC